jgi:transposase
MGVVLMSKRELNRIDILARLESDRLTPMMAASLLQVGERQVYRLMRRFRDDGPAGIADRRRGRPSNNRLPDVLREHAVALVREHYADFGPTLAAEKLEERHDLRVSRETLRTWMVQAGLWLPRAARRALRSAGLRTAVPGSVSPDLTDISTLRHHIS